MGLGLDGGGGGVMIENGFSFRVFTCLWKFRCSYGFPLSFTGASYCLLLLLRCRSRLSVTFNGDRTMRVTMAL